MFPNQNNYNFPALFISTTNQNLSPIPNNPLFQVNVIHNFQSPVNNQISTMPYIGFGIPHSVSYSSS
jgi:hypothetical protein